MKKEMTEVKEMLSQIIKNEVLERDIEQLNDETLLIEDLGLDSVQLMSLVVKLEEVFNIDFSDSDILFEKFNRIGDLCSLIEVLLEKSYEKK